MGESVCTRMYMHTYIRLGLLEDEQRQGEVSLSQADQVPSEQSFGSALFLSLAAVQERHHPLEGVLHVALRAGLVNGDNNIKIMGRKKLDASETRLVVQPTKTKKLEKSRKDKL